MKNALVTLVSVTLALALAVGARAQSLPAEERAFLDAHIPDLIQVEPERLNDDRAVDSVFAVPIYRLKVVIDQGDGAASTTTTAARVGDRLVAVSRPSTDGDYPDIQRMLRPDLRLTSDAVAATVQRALDVVYPLMGGSDEAAGTFRCDGADWTFVRGEFFDNEMGFVLTTDGEGAVTAVRYVLELPRAGS